MSPRQQPRWSTQLRAVIRKEVRQTVRDRRIMFLLIAAPLLQTIALGFAVDFNFENVPTLVVDLDECPIAEPALSQQIQQVRAHPPPKGGLKVVLRVMPEDWEVPPDSFFQNNFFLLPQLVAVVRDCLVRSGLRLLIDAYCGVGFFSLELADALERYVGIEIDPMG